MASSNVVGLVQRDQFVVVPEQQVDVVAHERRGSRRGAARRRTSRTTSATRSARARAPPRRRGGTPPWRPAGRTGNPPCTARVASAITVSSRSSTFSRLDTPRQVFIVRSASGVTTMTQRPVGVPWSMPPPRKVTPTARMSWPNTWPRSSVSTLPMYAGAPAETGEAAHRVGRRTAAHLHGRAERAYSSAARSISTSVIDPFTSPCSTRNSSVDGAITSTRALPMPVDVEARRRPSVHDRGHDRRHDRRRHVGHGPTRYRRYHLAMSDTASLPDLDSLDPYRLPTVARPTRYDLRLAPSLRRRRRFDGTVDDPARRRARNAAGWCSTPPN